MWNGLYVSNNTARKRAILAPDFIHAAGQLEAGYLDLSEAYLYGSLETGTQRTDQMETLNSCLAMGQGFITSLWLIKDSSVNLDTGFLIVQGQPGEFHSNRRAVHFGAANGDDDVPQEFTRDELKAAGSYFAQRMDEAEHIKGDEQIGPFKGSTRLQRALYWLEAARGQAHLPVRIALYCTCLETMLSTDTFEVTHKVAERTAVFLGTTLEEKLEIFGQVKEAYNGRSSSIHGDVLRHKSTSENLRSISVQSDELVRRAMRKVLENDDLKRTFAADKEQVDAYFAQLIFG